MSLFLGCFIHFLYFLSILINLFFFFLANIFKWTAHQKNNHAIYDLYDFLSSDKYKQRFYLWVHIMPFNVCCFVDVWEKNIASNIPDEWINVFWSITIGVCRKAFMRGMMWCECKVKFMWEVVVLHSSAFDKCNALIMCHIDLLMNARMTEDCT